PCKRARRPAVKLTGGSPVSAKPEPIRSACRYTASASASSRSDVFGSAARSGSSTVPLISPPLSGSGTGAGESVLDLPDVQVAKLHPVGVALQPDLAGGTLQSRVFLGDLLVLEAFVEVRVNDLLAVEGHDDPALLGADFHRVPFPGRLAGEFRRRDDV